jgi:LysM repeat protein
LTWLLALIALAWFTLASPARADKIHVVGPGHTLGKIAKRYHTSIDALCAANRIRRTTQLKLGQRIIIPGPAGIPDPPSSGSATAPAPERKPTVPGEYTTHEVARGHTLGKIARRFRTSVAAIRTANGMQRGESLRVGQCLVVPLDGHALERHRSRQLPCLVEGADPAHVDPARRPRDPYAARPNRPGVVKITRGGQVFNGRIFDQHGRPLPDAVASIDGLLFDRRTQRTHSTDPRLLETIVTVSDHFGGRAIEVVSGYREESSNHYTTRSNHALGRAIDFKVDGVPNEAVRDYCHQFSKVGVGYYPNSSFVHLDVRDLTTHWTDVSSPGESPRYTSMEAPGLPQRQPTRHRPPARSHR